MRYSGETVNLRLWDYPPNGQLVQKETFAVRITLCLRFLPANALDAATLSFRTKHAGIAVFTKEKK